MIGLFLPTKTEYDAMDQDHLRSLGAVPVLSGIGKINTVYSLAANFLRFDAYVLCGFAGGYRGLEVGQIVIPHSVVQADYYSDGLDDGAVPIRMLRHRDFEESLYFELAFFICQDRMIKGLLPPEIVPDDKKIAVDMETYAFSAFMKRAREDKFSTIRVISDLCNSESKEKFLAAGKTMAGQIRTAAEIAIKSVQRKCTYA